MESSLEGLEEQHSKLEDVKFRDSVEIQSLSTTFKLALHPQDVVYCPNKKKHEMINKRLALKLTNVTTSQLGGI